MDGIIAAFLILLGSWAAFRFRWISFDHLPAFRFVVLYVALPAFVFASFVKDGADLLFNAPIFLTMTIATLILYAIYFVIGRRFFGFATERAMLFGHGAVASNSLLLGVPIFALTFGAAINPIVSQIILFENIILLPMFMIVTDYVLRGEKNFRAIAGAIWRNQFLWAVGIAILVNAVAIPLPASILSAFELVGRAAAPIALITVGGILAKTKIGGHFVPAGLAGFSKLIALPFFGLFLGKLFSVEHDQLVILVLFLALPNASLLPVFGEQARFPQLSNSIFICSYAVAFFTLTAWLIWLT